MRKAVLFLMLCAMILVGIGCAVYKSAVAGPEGAGGWQIYDRVPKTLLNFVRKGSDSAFVQPAKYSTDVLWIRITNFTDRGDFPAPPFCKFEREEKGLIGGLLYRHSYYKIPEGKKFDDVYDWYINWWQGGKVK